jgi:hypothetical protein
MSNNANETLSGMIIGVLIATAFLFCTCTIMLFFYIFIFFFVLSRLIDISNPLITIIMCIVAIILSIRYQLYNRFEAWIVNGGFYARMFFFIATVAAGIYAGRVVGNLVNGWGLNMGIVGEAGFAIALALSNIKFFLQRMGVHPREFFDPDFY